MKKNILLIGVGGTGSEAVDIFFKKKEELGTQTENKITALVFDTDAGDLKKITAAKTVVMADPASVGTICDRIGTQYLQEWFPCDVKDVRAQEMIRGASQWRKKSYLAFLNLMNKPTARATFISALEEMVKDPGAICEVYVIASVAGGTGSGSFIPIALYAKRYLRKNLGKDPIVNAMIALPDIYANSQTAENKIKIYSNAYAILRELNAINLVARNYNAGVAAKKKAPIRFRIGHPDEPNVGVLFDASDKRFWTPEAAPFSQVFLLDRIAGINSVAAHNMVLANSLYTILCTEIGSAFDSEFSNHELVRSQNNGSNAIYAGISTAQIRFPAESVLEYLAHKKTLDACGKDWLVLHKAVEQKISEEERNAKAAKQSFSLKDSEYASKIIKTYKNLISENRDEVVSIVERCVDRFDEENKRIDETAGRAYIDTVLDPYIRQKMPSGEAVEKEVSRLFENIQKYTRNEVVAKATEAYGHIFKFYSDCFNAIKTLPIIISDSALTLDKKKLDFVGSKYSLADYLLLSPTKKHIHPVAAIIRLCEMRLEVAEEINKYANVKEWEELKNRSVKMVSEDILLKGLADVEESRSPYTRMENRFAVLAFDPNDYISKKSNSGAHADMNALQEDANSIIRKIDKEAKNQIYAKIYASLAANLDLLIKKYRSFFNRFEKELDILRDQVNDTLHRDEGIADSIINVYSSEKSKNDILALIDESNGPVTESYLREIDSITGLGVYNSVFASAVAEFSEDENFNDKDSGAYRSLFSSMVDATRKSIKSSEAYENLASYNVIEAITESCGRNDPKKMDDMLREIFSTAQEVATPPLRLDPYDPTTDFVEPSHIMVFMMSKNTARYIKRNADKFNLRLPASDNNDEKNILKACAEIFIQDYSGYASARVAIVDSIPDNILYCTGEIMDITPLRIAKFNELGEDNTYFKNYLDAIKRLSKYGTDMWNPHLGKDLHKRGYLPYMNAEMENACDEKMVKALLYALNHKLIAYDRTFSYESYQFRLGNKEIKANQKPINNKNISQLLNWLRNEDELINAWSKAFEDEIIQDKNNLPTIVSDTELATLEAALTNSKFMGMLNKILYEDPSDRDSDIGPTAVEFAYQVKTSEEMERDCDDADRIMKVLYKTFIEMIAFRTNPETNPKWFVSVYNQQLNKFYEAFAEIDFVYKAGKNCEKYFRHLVQWLNDIGLFLDVDRSRYMIDEKGKIIIDQPFDLYSSDNASVLSVLNKIKEIKKK